MKTKMLLAIAGVSAMGLLSFRVIEERLIRRSVFNTSPNGTVYIIIDKSDYELKVYDDDGWYATYPVVFGANGLDDKMMEGDRKTPEGTFRIISKRPHEKWHKMMMLDYPTKESWSKFNQRKQNGAIPNSAKIGGGIAIHGTWPNDDFMIDDYRNWTWGCISLKNGDLDDLSSFIPTGTKVMIRK